MSPHIQKSQSAVLLVAEKGKRTKSPNRKMSSGRFCPTWEGILSGRDFVQGIMTEGLYTGGWDSVLDSPKNVFSAFVGSVRN